MLAAILFALLPSLGISLLSWLSFSLLFKCLIILLKAHLWSLYSLFQKSSAPLNFSVSILGWLVDFCLLSHEKLYFVIPPWKRICISYQGINHLLLCLKSNRLCTYFILNSVLGSSHIKMDIQLRKKEKTHNFCLWDHQLHAASGWENPEIPR